MSRTRKRTTIPTSWDSNRVSRPRSTTPTRKAKNGKLLSGHTNTENKVLSFSYAHKEIASTTLVPYTYTYRANSTYDPDPALGGTSAYGHSHMGARYQKYYVKSARMQMIAGGHNSTKNEPLILMWADNKDSIPQMDLNDSVGVCLANGGKVFQLGHVLGNARPIMGIRVKTKDVFRGGIGDEDNTGASDGNPVNGLYFHVVVYPMGEDMTASNACNMLMNISYDTLWYDPVDII